MFIFSGSVFQAHADVPYSKILFEDKNQIHIAIKPGWNEWDNSLIIAVRHCNSNNKKFAFIVKRPGFLSSKLDKSQSLENKQTLSS